MKHLAIACLAGVFFSGAALAQQGGRQRPGDADPYASKAGAANPYAPRAGDPNPYATQAGEPHRDSFRNARDENRHSSRQEEKGYGYAKDPHGTHLPYGTSQGSSPRRR